MASNLSERVESPLVKGPLGVPLPRSVGDQFSLRYHVALEAMRMGKGNAAAAQALLEMVIAAGLLTDRGHGMLYSDQTRNAESAISKAAREGLRNQRWEMSADGYDALCVLASEHDSQLENASARDVIEVLAQVQRLSQWAATAGKQK